MVDNPLKGYQAITFTFSIPIPKGKRITFHHHFDEVITFDPHESGERPAEKVASARKVELRDPSLASPGGTYF
jgi:hypothetical protein